MHPRPLWCALVLALLGSCAGGGEDGADAGTPVTVQIQNEGGQAITLLTVTKIVNFQPAAQPEATVSNLLDHEQVTVPLGSGQYRFAVQWASIHSDDDVFPLTFVGGDWVLTVWPGNQQVVGAP